MRESVDRGQGSINEVVRPVWGRFKIRCNEIEKTGHRRDEISDSLSKEDEGFESTALQ